MKATYEPTMTMKAALQIGNQTSEAERTKESQAGFVKGVVKGVNGVQVELEDAPTDVPPTDVPTTLRDVGYVGYQQAVVFPCVGED